MKNKRGRPTDYDPKFIEEADKYLEEATKENMHLPKIVSFALRIGVNKTTLYEWEKKYPEFSNALGKIRSRQEERLLDDGIYGGKEINATIVKLALTNNHGYKDRSDITSDDKPIVGPILMAPQRDGRILDTTSKTDGGTEEE